MTEGVALVTGGSGFIGAALVRALAARGRKVRVLDNLSRGDTTAFGEGTDVSFVQTDIRDHAGVAAAMVGASDVFHLAYVNGTEHFYTKPGLVLDVAVRGQLAVMDAVAATPSVRNFIYLSSSEVYQRPDVVPTPERVAASVPDVHNPRYSYGCGKLLGEMMTLHAMGGVRRIVIRPHNVYGAQMGWEHVVPQLIEKVWQASGAGERSAAEIELQGDGGQTRAFCHIDDAIDGLLLASEAGEDGGIFHLGRNVETSIRALAAHIGHAMGVDVTLRPGEAPPGGVQRRCPDTTKLEALGYAPAIDLERGLALTVPWYLEALRGRRPSPPTAR